MLFSILCNHLFRVGTLVVVDANGRRHNFGGGGGPSSTIRFHDESLHWRLFFNPALTLGEAYMDGTLTVEGGTIYRGLLAGKIRCQYLDRRMRKLTANGVNCPGEDGRSAIGQVVARHAG